MPVLEIRNLWWDVSAKKAYFYDSFFVWQQGKTRNDEWHAIYFSRLFMILLVQFLWGWKWEVELTSCENVLTYFITKDAKLCKSFYSPSLYFFFCCTHYVYFLLLISPLSLDSVAVWHVALSLAGRCHGSDHSLTSCFYPAPFSLISWCQSVNSGERLQGWKMEWR